jgi:type I restriction enzyme S subunit
MVIEELFARLDSADRELVKARARVRRLRETTLDNRIWRSAGNHVTIDRLAELIRGVTYKKHEARDQPAPESAPLLRATNINVTLFLDSDLVYIPRSRVAKAQVLRSGDIVIATSSGSAAVVGKSAVLREHWDGTFGAFCAVLRASPGVDSSYLALVLRTRRIRERWSELARGTNINNLRAMHILQTEIPLPPYEEQRKIVSILEQELSLTDSLSAAAESTHRRSAALRRSILEHAFRGELVAQDPDDEPASALLERIHAERAAAPPRLRRRRVST